MEESFTIGEVAELFRRERRTIERWVARAQMNVADDAQDGRRKLLSKAQVEHLAHLHRITLPLKTQVAGPSSEAQLAALESRLTAQLAAERREREKLARRLEQLEQRIADDEQPTQKIAAVTRSEAPQTALPAPVVEQQHPRGYARKQEPVLALQAMHALVRAHFAPQLNAEPERIGRARLEQEPNISQATLAAVLLPLWQPLRGFHHCQDKGCPCHRL